MERKILTSLALIFFTSLSLSVFSQGYTDVSVTANVVNEHIGVPFADDMPFGSGAAWFDYDNDGWLDLYVTNRNVANKLYHNDKDGTFTEVAASMNVDDPTGDGGGVVIGDINNDGYPDIFLANGNEDRLFRNNGGTSFTDITSGSGLTATFDSRGTSGSFGDYNNDGYLDLYISHHIPIAGSSANATNQDFLFYNNGNETFTDVSTLLGISNLSDAGFIGGWTDFDHDGDLDIILINDCPISFYSNSGTKIFENVGGSNPITNWTFTEVAGTTLPDCSNGMGIGIGDYNRDGWMDIVYTDIGPIQLYRNELGYFHDLTSSAGVGTQSTSLYSWGTSFFDYNNDMWTDIVVSLGGFWPDVSVGHDNNFFENNGNGTFTDIAPALGVDIGFKTRNIVHGDYDNDGDLDMYMVNYDTTCMLFRNDVVNSNNFIRISLVGTIGNRDGLGAKIKVSTPDGVDQYFEMRSGTNLGGGDEMFAHFGLGSNTTVSTIEVVWLSGAVSTLTSVPGNDLYTISEPLVLPVELSKFAARPMDEKVRLEWTTASETNNDFFEIQRSTNGMDFKTIGTMAGRGNSNLSNTYKSVDEKPNNGKNYYRIKQVDFDGSSSFSHVASVSFKSTINEVKIYPNPVSQASLFFELSEETEDENITIEIFDIAGKMVYQKNINGYGNEGLTHEVSIKNLSNGIYLAKINSSTGIQTQRITVAK